MKSLLVVLVSFATCLFICSCGNTSNPCECTPGSAITVAHAQYFEGDSPGTGIPRSEHVVLGGLIAADPLPALWSVTLNGEEFDDPRCWAYRDGYITFGSTDPFIVIHSGLDPVEVVLATSAGEVSGVQQLPEAVTQLQFSEAETLQLGEPLTVSWIEGAADLYHLYVVYEWGDRQYTFIDTLVSGSSVTLDGSFFIHDGIIWEVEVETMNGPMPRPGATGNMSGYGTGYLYYSREWESIQAEIQVGEGLRGRTRRPVIQGSEFHPSMSLNAILRKLREPMKLVG